MLGSEGWLRWVAPGGEQPHGQPATFLWRSSLEEHIVTIFMSGASFCLYAMLIANVTRGMWSQDTQSRDFHRRVANLKKIEHQEGLDRELYHRIKTHHHYIWSCGAQAAGIDALRDEALTVDLRRELALAFYGKFLRSVPFLQMCDTVFLKQLCTRVGMESFGPQDCIIVAGEFGTNLYFLVVGQVMILRPKSREVLRELEQGSFFGEMGLLIPDSCRTVDVEAKTHGWMLHVRRESLQEICSDELLKTFRSVAFERYKQERNNMVMAPGTSVPGQCAEKENGSRRLPSTLSAETPTQSPTNSPQVNERPSLNVVETIDITGGFRCTSGARSSHVGSHATAHAAPSHDVDLQKLEAKLTGVQNTLQALAGSMSRRFDDIERRMDAIAPNDSTSSEAAPHHRHWNTLEMMDLQRKDPE
eukprot:gnl/TRDRNA2_/TRDRNA2_122281_c0_seq1.p1 gnl/TRDRNA2_/TRDRNA2_122281_c0~~gnl/TRDRNA2_/TRDRNA2_122281_c0_seq1.p1  ORF type:complete len:441 (+),score=69.82 gnl/TRDRNA2_/TRDRNA2_122281_c0_seq1:74-1324(+)